VIPVLILVAFLAAWTWFLYKSSRGRMWSPLWMAFSATAAAALFIGAGAIGYTLSKRDRFVAGTAWSDSVIWWQIGVGLALLPLAVYLSRKGARSLTPNPRAELRH
jgi:hypothetical protein